MSKPGSYQSFSSNQPSESSSEFYLQLLQEQEKIKKNRVPGVKTVLVVLSYKGITYDRDALKQKIHMSYPESTVFFCTTNGKPVGPNFPEVVDLVIDFTPGGSWRNLFMPRKFKHMAKTIVGRNTGLFRTRSYDRVFDEIKDSHVNTLVGLHREQEVQKKVLELAGIAMIPIGETPRTVERELPLKLPSMKNL